MLISRRRYNWNDVFHQTGGLITGWAYNRDFMVGHDKILNYF